MPAAGLTVREIICQQQPKIICKLKNKCVGEKYDLVYHSKTKLMPALCIILPNMNE